MPEVFHRTCLVSFESFHVFEVGKLLIRTKSLPLNRFTFAGLPRMSPQLGPSIGAGLEVRFAARPTNGGLGIWRPEVRQGLGRPGPDADVTDVTDVGGRRLRGRTCLVRFSV